MQAIGELVRSLNIHFNWHKARIDCFVKMLLALISVRTINLREIAIAFDSQADIDSRHKRIKRFFSGFTFDLTLIAFWIFQLFSLENKAVYLKLFTAKKVFKDLGLRDKKIFHMSVEIFGQKVYLAGSRSHRGEWMIVATNQKPFNAIEIYLRRWEVETLFANLKTKGFRFEDTHITDLKRLEKIMGLLAMGGACLGP